MQQIIALPREISSPPAERIARFLRHIDRSLTSGGTICIYGSSAVSLYFADDADEEGFTNDIDIGSETPGLDFASVDPTAVDPPMTVQRYSIERWLVHPDWRADCVDFTPFLETERLRAFIPHPLDLIVTKLERGEERDIVDCVRLAVRYQLDPEEAAQRVVGAAEFYPLSTRVVRQVERSFEGVFDRKLSLRHLL